MVALLALIASSPARDALKVFENQIVVISHRGDHTVLPENTVAADKAAALDGADFAEIDLRTTKDGKLVIMHDSTVDRMTDGHGKVRDLTLAEIKKLRIKGGTDKDSNHVPEFREVLRTCRGHIRIYLDFKDADVQQSIDELKRERMLDSIIVYTGGEEAKLWRKLAPEVPVITTAPQAKNCEELDAFFATEVADILDGPLNLLSDTFKPSVNKSGIRFWPDIMSPGENPMWWDSILKKGVTGMQSDHPGDLVRYLRSIGKHK